MTLFTLCRRCCLRHAGSVFYGVEACHDNAGKYILPSLYMPPVPTTQLNTTRWGPSMKPQQSAINLRYQADTVHIMLDLWFRVWLVAVSPSQSVETGYSL